MLPIYQAPKLAYLSSLKYAVKLKIIVFDLYEHQVRTTCTYNCLQLVNVLINLKKTKKNKTIWKNGNKWFIQYFAISVTLIGSYTVYKVYLATYLHTYIQCKYMKNIIHHHVRIRIYVDLDVHITHLYYITLIIIQFVKRRVIKPLIYFSNTI